MKKSRLLGDGGTPAALALDDLTDVDAAAVVDGQALIYDGASSAWLPADLPAAGGGAASTSGEGRPAFTTVSLAGTMSTTSGVWKAVAWDTEEADDIGAFSLASPSQVVVPAGVTRVRATAALAWQMLGTTTSGYRWARFHNVTTDENYGTTMTPGAYEGLQTVATPWVEVSPGDVLELLVSQSVGGTSTLLLQGSGFGGPSRMTVEWDDGVTVRPTATAKVTKSTTQAVPGNTPTAVTWDTEVWDDSGFWSAGQPTRMTVPVGLGGKYLVQAHLSRQSVASNYLFAPSIMVNGVEVQTAWQVVNASSVTALITMTVLDLADGDYVEASAWSPAAFTLDSRAEFAIARLGGAQVGEALMSLDLDGLTDVDLTTAAPADGDTLVYDATAGQWVPGAPTAGGGGGAAALDDLTDVDTTTATPTTGESLVWNGSLWVPGAPAASGSAGVILLDYGQSVAAWETVNGPAPVGAIVYEKGPTRRQAILGDNPVAFLTFDETTGNWLDAGTGGRNFTPGAGVVRGVTSLADDGGYAASGSGTAPIGTYSGSHGIGQVNWTMETMFKVPATGNLHGGIMKFGTNGNGASLGIGNTTDVSDGRNFVFGRNGINWYAPGLTLPADGLKHHLAVTCDASSTWRTYLDGVLQVQSGSGLTIGAAAAELRSGNTEGSYAPTGLVVDNMAWFNTILTASQIIRHAGVGSSGAKGWWDGTTIRPLNV